MRTYTIQGKEVELLTVYELGKIVGKQGRTLRRWEKEGILPRPVVTETIKSPIKSIGECERRLYSMHHAKALIWWCEKVDPHKGVIISSGLKKLLHDKWDEANQKFLDDLAEKNNVAQN